jgi:hypothetical protein
MKMLSGAQDCERLNAWLREKAVLLGEGCVKVTPLDFGLGLAAVCDVDAHTMVIDVPQHAIISAIISGDLVRGHGRRSSSPDSSSAV